MVWWIKALLVAYGVMFKVVGQNLAQKEAGTESRRRSR
jgi:hypothetical protein